MRAIGWMVGAVAGLCLVGCAESHGVHRGSNHDGTAPGDDGGSGVDAGPSEIDADLDAGPVVPIGYYCLNAEMRSGACPGVRLCAAWDGSIAPAESEWCHVSEGDPRVFSCRTPSGKTWSYRIYGDLNGGTADIRAFDENGLEVCSGTYTLTFEPLNG